MLLSLILIPLTAGSVNLINNVGANVKALSVHLIHGGAPTPPEVLPVTEILVRGSKEPRIAQSDVLLRAAQHGQETPKEELLRPTSGNDLILQLEVRA